MLSEYIFDHKSDVNNYPEMHYETHKIRIFMKQKLRWIAKIKMITD